MVVSNGNQQFADIPKLTAKIGLKVSLLSVKFLSFTHSGGLLQNRGIEILQISVRHGAEWPKKIAYRLDSKRMITD